MVRRRVSRCVLVLLCFIALHASFTVHAQPQARAFPPTRDGIFIFYDQPPYTLTAAQREFLALHYVGCQKIPLDLVDAIRLYSDDFMVLNYRLAFGTYEDISAYIVGNDWVNDWSIVDPHSDWFVTDSGSPNPQGRIMQMDWGWYLMDISGTLNGNTTDGWKEYWTQTVINQLRSTHSDGVFADSYGLPWNLDYTPSWLQPPDDVAWIGHMEIFGNHVAAALTSEPEQFHFIPNLGAWITTRDSTDYAAFVDGAMIEMFGSPGPWDLYELEDWKLEMNRVLDLENRGKVVICQPITEDEWAVDERMYNLANYLLIKGNHTYYNLVFGENFYDRLIFFPECTIDIGPYAMEPPVDIDDLFDPTCGLYVREYGNGRVYVNPTWDTRWLTLDDEYYAIDTDDLFDDPQIDITEDGSLADSVAYVTVSGELTVSPKGGLILLESIDPTCIDFYLGEIESRPKRLSCSPNPSTGIAHLACDGWFPDHDTTAKRRILWIHDVLGHSIRSIPVAVTGPEATFLWDGCTDTGMPVAPGVYFASLLLEDGQGLLPVATERLVRSR